CVGSRAWGFSVWAHNAACDFRTAINSLIPEGRRKLSVQAAAPIVGRAINEGGTEAGVRQRLANAAERLIGRVPTDTEIEALYQAAIRNTGLDPAGGGGRGPLHVTNHTAAPRRG